MNFQYCLEPVLIQRLLIGFEAILEILNSKYSTDVQFDVKSWSTSITNTYDYPKICRIGAQSLVACTASIS